MNEALFSDIGIFGVEGDVEYIRSDLAELTWEDMFKIVEIDMTLFDMGTTQKDVENHFKEVLRRFNVVKAEKKLYPKGK